MSEASGFFNANELTDGTYDREYAAEQFAGYFKLFVGNGVFASPTDQLKVMAGTGLQVLVKAGWGFVNGYWYHNDADLSLNVEANATATSRTDGIFLQCNLTDRTMKIVYGKERTAITRSTLIYELKLAEVAVGTGVTTITDAVITDKRSDETVCGFVSGLFDIIGTADLFAQYNAIWNEWNTTNKSEYDEWYKAFKAQADVDLSAVKSEWTTWKSDTQTDFNTWFNNLKVVLDANAAAHLQNEIDTANSSIKNNYDQINNTNSVLDLYVRKYNAHFDDNDKNILALMMEVTALAKSAIAGTSDNIVVEMFQSSVAVQKGIYDSANKQVYA